MKLYTAHESISAALRPQLELFRDRKIEGRNICIHYSKLIAEEVDALADTFDVNLMQEKIGFNITLLKMPCVVSQRSMTASRYAS